ncbi:hypothetical protein IC762_17460 [Bradyrhizobium genosp. L]|uniref:hypothetical protein n=1 Tax=Bradyrhizobium genosp. L TaxID=83637 RepID=UPI0018A26330|nr:hypothetical protein [Bradyrhizobium genosp. L]QPF81615.1 hypothetical protein IC762_17460 [Bradyrhizobium genosp. L]
MRFALALGLLLALGASASAAPAHHLHARRPAAARPPAAADVTPKARFAVPGWSDEDTRKWLDNASIVGIGG